MELFQVIAAEWKVAGQIADGQFFKYMAMSPPPNHPVGSFIGTIPLPVYRPGQPRPGQPAGQSQDRG